MLNKNSMIFGFIAAAAVGAVLVVYFRTAPTTASVKQTTAVLIPAPFKGPRTKADAMNALMELPELKAWSAHLTESSGGTVNGALVEYGPTPKVIGTNKYWQISYVENTPEAAHRWESFLVGENTGEILVEDSELDRTMTLAQWRQTKNPIARKSAQ